MMKMRVATSYKYGRPNLWPLILSMVSLSNRYQKKVSNRKVSFHPKKLSNFFCIMKSPKNLWLFSTFILSALVFTFVECKTVKSSERTPAIPTQRNSNVFVSMAKSLATEAISQFQESARRNPRLGFNITMLLPPSLNLTGAGANNSSLAGVNSLLGSTAQLGIIGLKGGILGIKAAIIQSIVVILFIIFLLTGIAYFACNIGVISCTGLGSSLGNIGGSGGGSGPWDQLAAANPFARNGLDDPLKLHRTTGAVYNALDEGQKKYT